MIASAIIIEMLNFFVLKFCRPNDIKFVVYYIFILNQKIVSNLVNNKSKN